VLSQPGIRLHVKEQLIVRNQRGARVASFEELVIAFLNEPPAQPRPAAQQGAAADEPQRVSIDP
jgi:hypothetical protein